MFIAAFLGLLVAGLHTMIKRLSDSIFLFVAEGVFYGLIQGSFVFGVLRAVQGFLGLEVVFLFLSGVSCVFFGGAALN